MPNSLGSVGVLPLVSRAGRAAERVTVQARKNGRADFVLHAPLVLHEGAAHEDDRKKDYSALVHAVLHDGAALQY